MKKKYQIYIVMLTVVMFLLSGCKDGFLHQQVNTQYSPDKLLKTKAGIKSVLFSAYEPLRNFNHGTQFLSTTMLPGDAQWDWGGGFEAKARPFMYYTWNAQNPILRAVWKRYYVSIRNSNTFLDNINNISILKADKIDELKAEATFVRALDYYYLWDLFGPVPLVKTTKNKNLFPSRPSEKEFSDFLETEFQVAAQNLPLDNKEGRATKGAALAFLGRFYLDEHKWSKSAKINKKVMKLNQYSLYQGDIGNEFAVKNEEKAEKSIIFKKPRIAQSVHGLPFASYTYPPKYPTKPNQINFGTQVTTYTKFVKSYNPDDKRLNWFLLKYTDTDGVEHNLLKLNNIARGPRCFKFKPDPNAIGGWDGNDFPMIRYAEVLLNRSEVLNEIGGPNKESIKLINKIRAGVGIPLYTLSDFDTKEDFRAAILKERGHEFIYEGLRRRDLIRQGKLIQYARARGVTNAQDYMTRFPIPQSQLDINPNLEQNTRY